MQNSQKSPSVPSVPCFSFAAATAATVRPLPTPTDNPLLAAALEQAEARARRATVATHGSVEAATTMKTDAAWYAQLTVNLKAQFQMLVQHAVADTLVEYVQLQPAC